MKSAKRKCSRCGNPGLHEKKRPATRTVAGHSFKASVPAQVCDSCGAVYFNGPALGNFDLAVANKLARAGVSDGEAIKFMRKAVGDRKSTRLNSSHSQISYAVFCLKKKKNRRTRR